jgi:beta-ureidopropionase / N-carbamoyl-L-amino-acid hydrolase
LAIWWADKPDCQQAGRQKPFKPIQNIIEKAAKKSGFTYKYLQSGAVQDAQYMALLWPMGMIFVPSVGGIRHSPKEFTKSIDLANGANILVHTILTIDKE